MAQTIMGSVPLEVQEDDAEITVPTDVINFEGDVSTTDEGNNKITVTIGEQGTSTGKLFDAFFIANGNTSDKWLGVGNGSTSSDTLPWVMTQDANLKAITFSNQDDDVDVDAELYKNGSLLYTWNIRNKRTAWITDLPTISVTQGDRVSLFLRKFVGGTGDSTAQDPIIELHFSITSNTLDEGGTQFGV